MRQHLTKKKVKMTVIEKTSKFMSFLPTHGSPAMMDACGPESTMCLAEDFTSLHPLMKFLYISSSLRGRLTSTVVPRILNTCRFEMNGTPHKATENFIMCGLVPQPSLWMQTALLRWILIAMMAMNLRSQRMLTNQMMLQWDLHHHQTLQRLQRQQDLQVLHVLHQPQLPHQRPNNLKRQNIR